MSEVLFWSAAALILYANLGYPGLMAALARLRPAPAPRIGTETPPLTVVLVAYNEEAALGDRLRNLADLDYPKDRLRILVVSDGSTDGTQAIATSFAAAGVELLDLPGPRGKAACLNDAVPRAQSEILLFADARQTFDRDVARRLVAYFGDPTIGAVSGELHLGTPEGAAAAGVGAYWRFEKFLRKAESAFDSTVGVTGAIYALRRSLFVPLDPRTILDDVAIPMEVALAGRRVVFAPEARAWDRIADDPIREYRRKVRTLGGNYQLVALRPALLNPFRNRLFWQFVSHKLARLAVPWCLVALFVANLGLAGRGSPFYTAALLAQLAFYAVAACGGVLARRRRPAGLAAVPYAFTLLNVAAAAALFVFLGRRQSAAWKTSR